MSERALSERELEQMEVIGDRIRHLRDQADEKWPEIVQAAAIAHDCKLALTQNGFTDEEALKLVGVLMDYIK